MRKINPFTGDQVSSILSTSLTPSLPLLLTFNKLLTPTYYTQAWHARVSGIVWADNKITHDACYIFFQTTRVVYCSITGLQRIPSSELRILFHFSDSTLPASFSFFCLLLKRFLKRLRTSEFLKW